jgi:hypothetical protein
MDMCPGVWPRLSTVPIPDTISAPGLIRVVRSVISLKAACVPGIMPRQRSGKEPWLDGGEICHVGARRAAADTIAVVARAMVGRKSLDSAATAGVTSACRASPDSARRPHGRPRCGPPPWRGFLVGRAERILRQQPCIFINFNPLWCTSSHRAERLPIGPSGPNPPRDGRGDLTNIARAIGEQEDVAPVRG